MQLVLGHFGPDRRQFQDLMPQWVLILAVEGVAATAALRGPNRNSVIGRQERPLLALVSRLPAGLATGKLAWRAAFDGGRIAGGRPRRVGRVLAEALLEESNLLLETRDLPAQSIDKRQNCGLGSRRHSIPEGSGNRQCMTHLQS
jgi:hypothetical protein